VQVRARIPGAAAASAFPVVVRPLRLAAVGDINLDGAPAQAYGSVGRALKSADLSFGNLETAVSTRGKPFTKEYNFRANPAALTTLKRATGIDALNLANNHTGDYGATALLDTIAATKRTGIQPIGAGRNLRQALKPRVVERLGLRVAFVGFSEIAPIEFSAGADRPGTAWANPSEIVAAVRAARRKADIVVATFHWGIELQTLETARQRELADVAVKAGAQVVLGAHPHTLEPVRRQGGALVAYSLGNFVFDAHSPDTTTTGILRLDLGAEGVTRASWRTAHIAGGRPLLYKQHPRRLPLRDNLQMQAGVNLPQL
jgi:poly-gamma-glutamate synthesis protein (capsule biosynthesis protein)